MEQFQIDVNALKKAGAANTSRGGGGGSIIKIPTRHFRYKGSNRIVFTDFGMEVTNLSDIDKGIFFYGQQNGLELIGVGPREKADSMKSSKAIKLAEKEGRSLDTIVKGQEFTSDVFTDFLRDAGLLPKEDQFNDDGKHVDVDFYVTDTSMQHPKDDSQLFVVRKVDDEAKAQIAADYKAAKGIGTDEETQEDTSDNESQDLEETDSDAGSVNDADDADDDEAIKTAQADAGADVDEMSDDEFADL